MAEQTERTRAALTGSGVEIFSGTAAFEAYDTVVLDGQTRLQGRRFVLATGSRPALPRIAGLVEAGVRDHAHLWDLSDRPGTLIILGAGSDALEFAQAFARLGTRVTILAEDDHLLPTEDADVSAHVHALLTADGVTIRTDARVAGVASHDGRKVVTYRGNQDLDPSEAVADEVLVAAGRLANVEELNLEAVGVFADPFDGVPVDDYLQTRAPTIFAVGDVLGHDRWTHAAEREAEIVFQNAVLHLARKMDYRAVPRVLFTDPEVATVGLTEAKAADGDAPFHVLKVDLAELDRACIDGATNGFAKVIASSSGQVLGAAIVAPVASAIIAAFALAIDRGLSLSQLADVVLPDPSYAGLVALLAEKHRTLRQKTGLTRNLLRWFYGFEPRPEQEAAIRE